MIMNVKSDRFISELIQYRSELGVTRREACSAVESKEFQRMLDNNEPLPDDVCHYFNTFCRVIQPDSASQQVQEFILHEQLKVLETIKSYLTFFVVLTVLGLVLTIIATVLSL
jgi:hypothetical protein